MPVDDAAGDDDACHARIGESQVLEALQRDHDRSRGHRQADEGGSNHIHAEQQRDAEADRERHDRADDGHAQRAFQRLEKFHRLGFDASVKHQEKDADFG